MKAMETQVVALSSIIIMKIMIIIIIIIKVIIIIIITIITITIIIIIIKHFTSKAQVKRPEFPVQCKVHLFKFKNYSSERSYCCFLLPVKASHSNFSVQVQPSVVYCPTTLTVTDLAQMVSEKMLI